MRRMSSVGRLDSVDDRRKRKRVAVHWRVRLFRQPGQWVDTTTEPQQRGVLLHLPRAIQTWTAPRMPDRYPWGEFWLGGTFTPTAMPRNSQATGASHQRIRAGLQYRGLCRCHGRCCKWGKHGFDWDMMMDKLILLGIFAASGFAADSMVQVAVNFPGGCLYGPVNRTITATNDATYTAACGTGGTGQATAHAEISLLEVSASTGGSDLTDVLYQSD
jgi:hypothetical protein